MLLWNPPVINPDLGIRASARSQSMRIARHALRARLKTIVFAQSRLMVEVLTKYLKDVFDHDPRSVPRVRAYRGGYLPTERRATERSLRDGSVDAVVTTSALELGVDIGALDVAILNGYPGSIAATWQRLGRAGRRLRPALGVLVASSAALDQYVIRHPEFFERAPPETARIAPDQLLILLDHIRCAAFELPFAAADRFGRLPVDEFLEVLAESGVVHREDDRWDWIADSYPAQAVSLRSVADGNFIVIDRTHGAQTIIAEVDYSSAALTLYEGAIYMVQSQPFQVERLDWPGRKAFVTRTNADYYTDAIDYTRLKVLERFDGVKLGGADAGAAHDIAIGSPADTSEKSCTTIGRHADATIDAARASSSPAGGRGAGMRVAPGHCERVVDASARSSLIPHATCHHGEVHVARHVSGYKKIRFYSHENIGYGPVNLPDHDLQTSAVWWQLPQAVLESAFASRQDALDGFLSAAYALHTVACVSIMADARDLRTAVGSGDAAWFASVDAKGRGTWRNVDGQPVGPDHDPTFNPTAFLYDNFPGGIGLSEPLFRRAAALVDDAIALVAACECAHGCPACIGPVLASAEDTGSGHRNERGAKALALTTLRLFA